MPIIIDTGRCTRCGLCIEECPSSTLALVEEDGYPEPAVPERCVHCGHCMAICPVNAVSAPLVSDCFGMDHFASIFGMVFTAFGFVSGILGPWLGGYLLDATHGNFTLVYFYMAALMITSSLMIWITSPHAECTF